MRRRLLLALVPALPAALVAGACSQPAPVELGLSLVFPQGLLDTATGMTLSVFDAALGKCDATTGHVASIPGGSATQTFPLSRTGCTGGDLWCATIKLDKDGSTKMFAIVATNAGQTVAEGCTTAVVDQDPLQVEIQAHRFSPPKCCGDGVLEPGEQCDNGLPGNCSGGPTSKCSGIQENPACYCDCTAKEILLSIDDTALPLLKNGPAGTKQNLAFTFGPGGVQNPNMLRAVFENTGKDALGGADIDERFLTQDLYPIADPNPLSLQLRLPLKCAEVQGSGIVRQQRSPAIATASSNIVAVVYQSDEQEGAGDYDIELTPQNADGCVDTMPCAQQSDCATTCDPGKMACTSSVKLNTSSGSTDPRIARGPDGVMLVTWTRQHAVFGRIWRTDGSLAPLSTEISLATSGSAARVAGSMSGFRVVYQGSNTGDADGIFMLSVDKDGNTSGATLVNIVTPGLQDQPDIAMLDDGSTLVVWHSGGDILFQRFDPHGKAVLGDQNAPLNTSGLGMSVDQQHPAAAAANGFFAVAWEATDPKTGLGNIWARFLGGAQGFGYNSVTGQNDEFVATDPAQMGADRHLPAVTLGPYTVIGWEDHAASHPGVFVRRFPPPVD